MSTIAEPHLSSAIVPLEKKKNRACIHQICLPLRAIHKIICNTQELQHQDFITHQQRIAGSSIIIITHTTNTTIK